MDNFNDKTAFITGAASGIGFALAKALAREGANIMMADINQEALETAAQDIRKFNTKVETCICDVAKSDSVAAAAKETANKFGNIHMIFNNAGVGLGGAPGNIPLADWQWIVDINLMGVVYGVEAFTPLMRAHGEPAYIINTASMAGHFTMPGMSPYHATKFAVVGYSETLAQELAKSNIGVSVLCPTWVKSNIYNAADNRPTAESMQDDQKTSQLYQMTKGLVDNGMSADMLAQLVLSSMRAKRFYIFNDAEARASVDIRRNNILADYDACLKDLEDMA